MKLQPKLPVLERSAKGVLTVKDFEPRTFGKALKPYLPGSWEKSGAKLAKAIKKCPDLLTLVIGLMNSYEDYLWDEREKLDAASKERLAALKKSKTAADADAEMTSISQQINLFDDRIANLAALSPAQWLTTLSEIEYIPLVESVQEFLGMPVAPGWLIYSPALDTASGKAAHALRQLPVEVLQAMEVSFIIDKGASCPFTAASKLSAVDLQGVAAQYGLELKVTEAPAAPKAVKKAPAKKVVTKKAAAKKPAAAK